MAEAAPAANQVAPETLWALNEKVSELATLRAWKKEREEEDKRLNAEITALEVRILDALEAAKLPTFAGTKGTVTNKEEESVKVPASPEQRRDFFGFLRERGIFDEMITVNSQTLNSFYKRERESAIEAGNYLFQIPGLETPKPYRKLAFRAAK